jgi:tetratricopeptide (TPR) repeat protein
VSTSNVLRFEDYRDRRAQRLRIAESLYSSSKSRLALLTHVSEACDVTGADRAGIVWVDEYGPGLVHPHVVLDLRSDRPRRSFSPEPLRQAWELGVPGALDEPGTLGARSLLAVALGSDGTRAWFLITESGAARSALSDGLRERIMFIAGECSTVVLHRDLDTSMKAEDGEGGSAKKRFAGWPILKDIEGRESDERISLRIGQRFAVARLARMLIDDDLTLPADRVAEQVVSARKEIAAAGFDDCAEVSLWHRVLDAFEAVRLDELASALTELGSEVESGGHANGALELYSCAYDIAAATGRTTQAIDSARFSGRTLRRLGRFDESNEWYSVAKDVALAAGDHRRAALVLAGRSAVDRVRGNLPAARVVLGEALEAAIAGGDSSAEMTVYLEWVNVEQTSNNTPLALEYGWKAVTRAQSQTDRLTCLAVLGGSLAEAGEWSAAEDAWTVVARESRDNYYLIYAWDALAYLAAMRGDRREFEVRAGRCDALGWQDGPRAAAVEILHYRGLSYRALGLRDEARDWLTRAVQFAEEHRFGKTLFDAEEALKLLDSPGPMPAPVRIAASSPAIRLGLREMREGSLGAGV